jgi:hypothetical protein
MLIHVLLQSIIVGWYYESMARGQRSRFDEGSPANKDGHATAGAGNVISARVRRVLPKGRPSRRYSICPPMKMIFYDNVILSDHKTRPYLSCHCPLQIE